MNYSVVKGTRDFLPNQMIKRNYIFNSIKSIFELHGFCPIETPSIENLSTLMGKYGEEGDRLIYKILNSGDFLKGIDLSNPSDINYKSIANKIAEKGLRYDLTVPFARFVVNNRNEINFPFKRYQIQPVWRADRPQKGRYREFYQCDVDIIGSNSLLNEIELCEIIDEVFSKLNLNITIKLNNRKILSSISEIIGKPEMLTDITVAIDKIEKIGYEKVICELLERGLDQEDINKIDPILKLSGNNKDKISQLKTILSENETGLKGIEELETVFNSIDKLNLSSNIEFDITLARGLNYYTGCIFEVKANDFSIGSITGGGRYDNLTGVFGLDNMSGVGISFGADRIYDCLEALDLFPKEINNTTKLLFINFGERESQKCIDYARVLRKNNISSETYPDKAKLQKQMKYANDKNIPFVALIGEREIEENKIMVKNMISGEQTLMDINQLIAIFNL
ncbi:MAG: histidine--tRNA ligase [Bacteroidales bacterium]|jgi:histidyl-tRNA synthetase|nr:histidine--tRNA ligase [Bacteroidales bacterium]